MPKRSMGPASKKRSRTCFTPLDAEHTTRLLHPVNELPNQSINFEGFVNFHRIDQFLLSVTCKLLTIPRKVLRGGTIMAITTACSVQATCPTPSQSQNTDLVPPPSASTDGGTPDAKAYLSHCFLKHL